jgi:hypothetical protein
MLALLSFSQGRDIRRLREWAGSSPERDADLKESTSTVAAQRAEELRQIEEGRRAEQEAAEYREERRRRREAGLPEDYTLAERIGGWLPEGRYLAAIAAVLVVLGAGAYLVIGGGEEDGGKGGRTANGQLRPDDVEVTVLNGTAVPGLAATFGDRVERQGYKLGTVTNSTSSFETSAVMFRRGSAPEARRVARDLDISDVRPMAPEISSLSAGAPVSVVIGEDNAAP